MELVIFAGALFGAIIIGMPIAFALIMTGMALMFYMDMFNSQLIAENLVSGSNNFSLMAIPFFILAGELMNAGGITRRIIDLGMTMLGHKKGGMGYVTIVAAILFASLSGSAVADTVALGAILIPLMVKAGYDHNRSCGLIASSGIIAPILPPSIPLILFGVTSGVSISQLFIAGLAPGLMMGVLLIFVWWYVTRKEDIELLEKASLNERLHALKNALWALILPVIIVVGLRFGVFTPTEAGAVAAFYALFIGIFVYRELTPKRLYSVLVNCATLTSIIMFLVAASSIAAWMITMADIPGAVSELLQRWKDDPTTLMIIINILVLIIGMAMDLAPVILILTPVLMPVVTAAGIDPVYFGIVFVLNLSIGLLTPPVGTVLAAISSVGNTSMGAVTKGIAPFLLAQLALLIALILFPSLVLVPFHALYN
ncbi:TRAP transporter large permease subunit [Marinomonas foliarum]|jgi:TRAP-type transport system large permease protein|uniref:TRAP transporter large permease protein n=1 Tax=Marinomonas foliarum TaxID=491950 RepID=A0A369AG48_9GAMM|nr:TRAP transporter large permease subunit [Marinomonas foliarum]QRV23669.1 TRAP transporter large permease subunit [Marinomonas foliarum]RCX07256.1 tripartite ATP-independent transporter DctM subunit [Marinomonas foliarum]